MKYVSLDIETTCLEPANPSNILQLSMVVEDSNINVPVEKLPHFTVFLNQPVITGNAYALALNSWILEIISGRNKTAAHQIIDPDRLAIQSLRFLNEHFDTNRKIPVAGKNVTGFDLPFLPKELRDRFAHRAIDPGTSMIDWENDRFPPDLKTCKERAGINTPVSHDAYEDALDVIRVMRFIKCRDTK